MLHMQVFHHRATCSGVAREAAPVPIPTEIGQYQRQSAVITDETIAHLRHLDQSIMSVGFHALPLVATGVNQPPTFNILVNRFCMSWSVR
jgi:hypothetical protein